MKKMNLLRLVTQSMMILFLMLSLGFSLNAQLFNMPPGWNQPEYNDYYFGTVAIRISWPYSGRMVVCDYTDDKDYSLTNGDWIGYFDDEGKCCGAASYDNQFSNFAITLVGDIPWTDNKEGFYEGEQMYQKIYHRSLRRTLNVDSIHYVDDSDSTIYPPGMYCWKNIFCNTKLYVVDTLVSNVYLQKQQVTLINGWNGLSSYLCPINDDITYMFADFSRGMILVNPLSTCLTSADLISARDLIILIAGIQVYWPDQGINTMDHWWFDMGYIVKVDQTEIYTFVGLPIPDELKILPLKIGWQTIPVMTDIFFWCYVNFDTLTGGVTDIVKPVALPSGKIYWPYQNIMSLEYLEPGNAYKIHLEDYDTVYYNNFVNDNGWLNNIDETPNIYHKKQIRYYNGELFIIDDMGEWYQLNGSKINNIEKNESN